MEDNLAVISSARAKLMLYFDIDIPEKEVNNTGVSLKFLREKLIPLIEQYLQYDIAQLLNLLYRIDISESQLKSALVQEKPAELICELIIEREIQKAKSRYFYRQNERK